MNSISVVIPVLNEEENLSRCLNSLTSQLQKGDEIVIVDNGSKDHTLEIASRYKCKIFVYPEASLGEVRMLGVEQASNPIVLEAAGDLVFKDGFIEGHRKHYENPEVVAVRGNMLDFKGRLLGDLTYTLASNMLGLAHASYSFRRNLYMETNKHKPVSFGEDVFLWDEISKHGRTIHDSSLIVYHCGLSSDKYVSLPSYAIGASFLAGGGAYEVGVGGELGYLLMGHGAGWMAGQAGVELLRKVPGIEEYWSDPDHLHHWKIGMLILAAGMAFSPVLPEEIEYALYGFGSGLVIHDIVTDDQL